MLIKCHHLSHTKFNEWVTFYKRPLRIVLLVNVKRANDFDHICLLQIKVFVFSSFKVLYFIYFSIHKSLGCITVRSHKAYTTFFAVVYTTFNSFCTRFFLNNKKKTTQNTVKKSFPLVCKIKSRRAQWKTSEPLDFLLFVRSVSCKHDSQK